MGKAHTGSVVLQSMSTFLLNTTVGLKGRSGKVSAGRNQTGARRLLQSDTLISLLAMSRLKRDFLEQQHLKMDSLEALGLPSVVAPQALGGKLVY